MANINRGNAGEMIRKQKRELQSAIRISQRACDHKNRTGPCLINVHDDNNHQYIKDRAKLSADAVICKECGDIFEMTAYQADEIESAVSLLKSALNQIKVLANLNEEEFNDIVELIAFFDEKIDGALVPYYMNMIKRLAGDDKRRRNDNSNQKGRVGNIGGNMGVSARSFR